VVSKKAFLFFSDTRNCCKGTILEKTALEEMTMEQKRILTDTAIKKFRKRLKKDEKSQSTIEKYIRDVRKFQQFLNGKPVTTETLLDYKMYLRESGEYKINSINSFLTAINYFCKKMEWKEVKVKTFRTQKSPFEPEEKDLTKLEYEKLVRTAYSIGDEKTALIIQTIGSTGIRASELRHLHVQNICDGQVEINNKGKVRCILLPTSLVEMLKKYIGKQNISQGCIFLNTENRPIDRKSIWRNMKRVAKYARIQESKVFPHNLRHLFAKEFYRKTGDIMKLADILGHSNVNTTRIYIRTTYKEHKRQLDGMNMVFPKRTLADRRI
jgi:site-specific recombinase XerD